MFIELVDVLRCPHPHEESWLVLSASRMRDRHVIEGKLGCHVCQHQFEIRDGVALFDASAARSADHTPSSPDAAFRMAALLGLAEPGGIVLMVGAHGSMAPTLAGIISDTQFLCVNVGRSVDGVEDPRISHLSASQRLPLSSGSCRAAVIDEAHATPAFLTDTIRVLRGAGRLVFPATAAVPDEVVELARDSSLVVAERASTPGPLIPLQSSRRK